MKNNIRLLLLVIIAGCVCYWVHRFDFKIYNVIDRYSSPYGTKPPAAWERTWEEERAK